MSSYPSREWKMFDFLNCCCITIVVIERSGNKPLSSPDTTEKLNFNFNWQNRAALSDVKFNRLRVVSYLGEKLIGKRAKYRRCPRLEDQAPAWYLPGAVDSDYKTRSWSHPKVSHIVWYFHLMFLPDYQVDCGKFVEHGCLSITLASLSSLDLHMRQAGYHVLSRFMMHLEGARFWGKKQVIVRNALFFVQFLYWPGGCQILRLSPVFRL